MYQLLIKILAELVVMLSKSYKSDYDIRKTQVLKRLSHFDKLGSEFYFTSEIEEKYKCLCMETS